MKGAKSSVFENNLLEKISRETPFFVFSQQKIKDKFHKFQKCFPGSGIHYAIKANSEPEVLKICLNGTSVKSSSHIKEFYDYGVDKFALDSFSELEKISIHAPGSKVFVRTIANDAGSVFKFSEKFGTEKENIIPLLKRAGELGLIPYGISFHVGSQA